MHTASHTESAPASHPPSALQGRTFLELLQALLSAESLAALCERFGPGPQGQHCQRISRLQLLQGLIFHFIAGAGSLAKHIMTLFGIDISESALSQRRARLPWELLEAILAAALRPLAEAARHPWAFHRGLRLVAWDGTSFSVANTPGLLTRLVKAKCRRGMAAFAKLPMNVLLELGLHNPLALAVGRAQEDEGSLARRLLAALPAGALLLADRLYGCGAWAQVLAQRCAQVGSHFLVRARGNLKVREIERLADGSRLVEVLVREPGKARREWTTLRLREVLGSVRKAGQKAVTVRLWTSLLDADAHPALELLALYARRWEQELYYHQIKHQLRGGERLQSYTLETAAQEVAALVLGTAVLARQRAELAQAAGLPAVRLSFAKVLHAVRSMWDFFAAAEGVISSAQAHAVAQRHLELILHLATLPPRRVRTCARTLRQPIQKFPRTLHPVSHEGELLLEILPQL